MSRTERPGASKPPMKGYIVPQNYDPNALEYSRVMMSTAPKHLPICSTPAHDSLLSRGDYRKLTPQPDIPVTDADGKLLPLMVRDPDENLKALAVTDLQNPLVATPLGPLLPPPPRVPTHRLPSSQLLSFVHPPTMPPVGYARGVSDAETDVRMRGMQPVDRWVSQSDLDTWKQAQGSTSTNDDNFSRTAFVLRDISTGTQITTTPTEDAKEDDRSIARPMTSTLSTPAITSEPISRTTTTSMRSRPMRSQGTARTQLDATKEPTSSVTIEVIPADTASIDPITISLQSNPVSTSTRSAQTSTRPPTSSDDQGLRPSSTNGSEPRPNTASMLTATLPQLPLEVPISLASAWLQSQHDTRQLPLLTDAIQGETLASDAVERSLGNGTRPLTRDQRINTDALSKSLAAQIGQSRYHSERGHNALAREVAANALRMLARARDNQSAWQATAHDATDAFNDGNVTENPISRPLTTGYAPPPSAQVQTRPIDRPNTQSSRAPRPTTSSDGSTTPLDYTHTVDTAAPGLALPLPTPLTNTVLLPSVSAPHELVYGWLSRIASKVLSPYARNRASASGSHQRSALDALGLSHRCLREAHFPEALQQAIHEALYTATAGAISTMRRLVKHSARGAALLSAIYEAYVALLNAQEPAVTRWIYACVHLHQLKRAHATLATCREELSTARHTNARLYTTLAHRLQVVWKQTHQLVLSRAKLLSLRLRLASLRRIQEALQHPLSSAKAAAADWRAQIRLAGADVETVTRLVQSARRQYSALHVSLLRCERDCAADAAVTVEARRVIRIGERMRRTLQVACDAAETLLQGSKEEEEAVRAEAESLRQCADELWRRRRTLEGIAAIEEALALNIVNASVSWMRDPALASSMRSQPHRRRELLLGAVEASGAEAEKAAAKARRAREAKQKKEKALVDGGEGKGGDVGDNEAVDGASGAGGHVDGHVDGHVNGVKDNNANGLGLGDDTGAHGEEMAPIDGPAGFTLQRANEIIARKRDYLARAETDAAEHVAVCDAETLALTTELGVLNAEAVHVDQETLHTVTTMEELTGVNASLGVEATETQAQLTKVVEMRVEAEIQAADIERGALAVTLREIEEARAEIAYLTTEHAARSDYARTIRAEAAAVSRETTEQAEAYERTQAELQRMYREKGDAARRGVANSNALREMLEEQVRQEQSLIRAREDVKKEIARERKTLAEQKETAHVLEEQVERSTAFLKEVETVRTERERALQEMESVCRNREFELRTVTSTLSALQTQQIQRNEDHNLRRTALTTRCEDVQRQIGATRYKVTIKRDELQALSAMLRNRNADYRARLATAQVKMETRKEELIAMRQFVVSAHAAATQAYESLLGELAQTMNALARVDEEHAALTEAARMAYEERKEFGVIRKNLEATRSRQHTELRLLIGLCSITRKTADALSAEATRSESFEIDMRTESMQHHSYQNKLLLLAGQQQYTAAVSALFSRKHRAVQHVPSLSVSSMQTDEVVVSHRGTRAALQGKVMSLDALDTAGRLGEENVGQMSAREGSAGRNMRAGKRIGKTKKSGDSGDSAREATSGRVRSAAPESSATDASTATRRSVADAAVGGDDDTEPEVTFEPIMASPPQLSREIRTTDAPSEDKAEPTTDEDLRVHLSHASDAAIFAWVRSDGMGVSVTVTIGSDPQSGIPPLVVPSCVVLTPAPLLKGIVKDTIATVITIPTLPLARASMAEAVGETATMAEDMAMVRAAGQFQRLCQTSNSAVESAVAAVGRRVPDVLIEGAAAADANWGSDEQGKDEIDAIIRYALQLRQRGTARAIPAGHVAVQVMEPEPVAKARVNAVGQLLTPSERYYYEFACQRREAMTVEDLYLYAMIAKETHVIYGEYTGPKLSAALDYMIFKLDVLDRLTRAASLPIGAASTMFVHATATATTRSPATSGSTSIDLGFNALGKDFHSPTVTSPSANLSPTHNGGVNAEMLRRLLASSRAGDDEAEAEARQERERKLAELLDVYTPGAKTGKEPENFLQQWISENPELWAKIQAENAEKDYEAPVRKLRARRLAAAAAKDGTGASPGQGDEAPSSNAAVTDLSVVAPGAGGEADPPHASAKNQTLAAASKSQSDSSTESVTRQLSRPSVARGLTMSGSGLPLLPQPFPGLGEESVDVLDVAPGAGGLHMPTDDATGEGGMDLDAADGESAFRAIHSRRSSAQANAFARHLRSMDHKTWRPDTPVKDSEYSFPNSPNSLLYSLLARENARESRGKPNSRLLGHAESIEEALAQGRDMISRTSLHSDMSPPRSPRSPRSERNKYASMTSNVSRYDDLFAELEHRFKDQLKPSAEEALAALMTPRTTQADDYLLLQERLLPRQGNEALLAQVQASGQRMQRESAVVRTRTHSQRSEDATNGTLLPMGVAAFVGDGGVGVGGQQVLYTGPGSRDPSPQRIHRVGTAGPGRVSSQSPPRTTEPVPAPAAPPKIPVLPTGVSSAPVAPISAVEPRSVRESAVVAPVTQAVSAPRDIYAGRTTGQRVETVVLGGNINSRPNDNAGVGAGAGVWSDNSGTGLYRSATAAAAAVTGSIPSTSSTGVTSSLTGKTTRMSTSQLQPPLARPVSLAQTPSGGLVSRPISTGKPLVDAGRPQSVLSVRAPVVTLPPLAVLTQPRGRSDKNTTDAVKAAIMRATAPKKN